MAVPKFDELTKPLLEVIKDGESYTIKDVTTMLAQRLNLSSTDLADMLPSGRQTVFKNRVGWAKTYLLKAGLIESPARATIRITAAEKKVVNDNPDKIDTKYLEQFPSFVNFISAAGQSDSDGSAQATPQPSALTPDDQLEDAYEQINASLASDLFSEVLKISPITFEKFVVDLLSHMGYGALAYGSHATVASGDDGIDGIIMKDRLGFSLIYMQAKKWAPDRVVNQPEIRNLVGAIAGKHGDGLFVTTAKFSQGAKDYAKNQHVILIDGERLVKLMIEHNFCVTTQKTFEVKKLDTDALAEYQDE